MKCFTNPKVLCILRKSLQKIKYLYKAQVLKKTFLCDVRFFSLSVKHDKHNPFVLEYYISAVVSLTIISLFLWIEATQATTLHWQSQSANLSAVMPTGDLIMEDLAGRGSLNSTNGHLTLGVLIKRETDRDLSEQTFLLHRLVPQGFNELITDLQRLKPDISATQLP